MTRFTKRNTRRACAFWRSQVRGAFVPHPESCITLSTRTIDARPLALCRNCDGHIRDREAILEARARLRRLRAELN